MGDVGETFPLKVVLGFAGGLRVELHRPLFVRLGVVGAHTSVHGPRGDWLAAVNHFFKFLRSTDTALVAAFKWSLFRLAEVLGH